MYDVKWSYPSLFLYLFIGLLACFFIKKATKVRAFTCQYTREVGEKPILENKNAILYQWFFILLFALFASERLVTSTIGGSDANQYIYFFESGSYLDRWNTIGIVYVTLSKIVRFFTANYKILFFVIYAFIAFSYCKVIKVFATKEMSYIPFICLLYPYLQSFNTIRSSVAIAFFALAICMLKKSNLIGYAIFTLLGIFTHIMILVYAPVGIVWVVYRKSMKKMNNSKLLAFSLILILTSTIASRFLQTVLLNSGILEMLGGAEEYYLGKSLGSGILGSFFMYAPHLFLLIAMWIIDKNIIKNDTYIILKTICLYDIVLILPTIVFNIWRANEVLYPLRLILWGYYISFFGKKMKRDSKYIYLIAVIVIFTGWLVFRLWRTYEGARLMPYKFEWFN